MSSSLTPSISCSDNVCSIIAHPTADENMLIEEIPYRQSVDAEPKIRLVDSDPDNKLELFCYETCDINDNDVVKSCRGVAFHGEDIVFKGFSFTPEYTQANDADQIAQLVGNNVCTFHDSYEGTLVRIFSFQNKWYISTNRKLDANKSKWASRTSFGEFFRRALEYEIIANAKFRDSLFQRGQENPTMMHLLDQFLDKLDTSKSYMFLLLTNPETRIVCQYASPKILHVGTYSGGGESRLEFSGFLGLDSPKQHYFESIDDMYTYVRTADFTVLQGLIAFYGENNEHQFKIMNPKYVDLYNIRGNEASVKFRYLQLRNDPVKCDMLRGLYLDHCFEFDYYETCISNITDIILEAYINRYIRKQYVVLPLEQFIVMSEVHKWYMTDVDNHKVRREIVLQKINEQTPVSINRMLKKYIIDTKKKVI